MLCIAVFSDAQVEDGLAGPDGVLAGLKDGAIVATFTTMKTTEAKKYEPTVVFVDQSNKLKDQADEPTELKMELPTAAEVDEETPFAPEPVPVRRARRKPA